MTKSAKTINDEVLVFLKKQELVTCAFSSGKDSLTCLHILLSNNIKTIPIYYYLCPDLDFVEKSLKKHEKLFGLQIIRMPHPVLYDFLRHQDFQPPKMIEYLSRLDFPKATFEIMIEIYLDSIELENKYFDVVGLRANESFNRRKVFEKGGFINHAKRKIYPIADWKKVDINDYLKDNDIPISDDYKIWPRSYDGMKYQFLFGMREHYPKDYETLKEYFPLVDLELKRYEYNRQYFED